MLGALGPGELEAVLAHELAHVRRRDVLVQTAAVLVAVLLVETSRIGGWLERALLAVLGPVAAAFVHLLLSPKRELAADRVAAALCGPDAIADALLRLDRASDLVSFEANPATEPLYTVNPFAEEGLAALFVTHPPLRRRIEALRAV
jgi:heat shock protein HtpX